VFALRWGDIGFDKKLIHVCASNNEGTITTPKTAAGETRTAVAAPPAARAVSEAC
jgi:hypothetical protein